MGLLVVKFSGSEFAKLSLQEGQEYIIGRNSDADVVLTTSKGVSRKHLRVFQDNGVWTVECLSRLANLTVAGQPVSSQELFDGSEFNVGAYSFNYVEEEVAEEEPSNALFETSPETIEDSKPKESKNKSISPVHSPNLPMPKMSGQTQVMDSSLKAFLKVSGTDSGKDSILELEGSLWVAGRDPNCEIHIDDSLASRKHFEISRIGVEFYICDLDSANGTELNGQFLVSHKPIKILSGDTISIEHISIFFEVRDVNFEEKFENAKKQIQLMPQHQYHQPMTPQHYQMLQLPPPEFSDQGVIEEIDDNGKFEFNLETLKNFDFKKHKIKVILAALVPFLIFGLLDDGSSPKPSGKKESASVSKSFDSLSDEQKVAIKDMFNLAQQHFHTLKYELCLSELKKLHEVIPSYENSKKLKGFCEQGAILLRQEEDRQARERKKQETEQKITTTVEFCRQKLTPSASEQQAQECMQPAIELDPQHPNIVAFLEELKARDAAKEVKQQQQARIRQLQQQGRRQLNNAQKLANQDQLSAAVKEYRAFLKRNYPGLSSEEKLARRELASVKTKLDEKVSTLLDECESLRSNSKFKDAWMACDRASKEDPSNEKAIELKKQALSDLRKEMKSIYQDSILEESLGNVDVAKEKWHQIRKNDLETDEYYKKATRKLQKYGEGI